MKHEKINSSSIASVGYDGASRTLEVKYKGSGKTYAYPGVGYEQHMRLMMAKSPGAFVEANIKPNHQGKEVK